jgi:nucleoside-diphosphate-sugar epimerase
MKVVIIGGRGKVGTYLVPQLVDKGYDVTNVSRGISAPFLPNPAWDKVKQVNLDRVQLEAQGRFAGAIAKLEPDILIDMICFRVESMEMLTAVLKHKLKHYLACGSIWIHERITCPPVRVEEDRNATDDYGHHKNLMELHLKQCSDKGWFAGTVAHAGHIVGPGHKPVNPAGNKGLYVFHKLMHGEELALPHFGAETIHHVYAKDVAQVFIKSIENPEQASGQGFHAVSERAISLQGYAHEVAGWFGKQAHLQFMPFDEWAQSDGVSPEDVEMTRSHIMHAPSCSIEKAKKLIGYKPEKTSLEAVRESVDWLIAHGELA